MWPVSYPNLSVSEVSWQSQIRHHAYRPLLSFEDLEQLDICQYMPDWNRIILIPPCAAWVCTVRARVRATNNHVFTTRLSNWSVASTVCSHHNLSYTYSIQYIRSWPRTVLDAAHGASYRQLLKSASCALCIVQCIMHGYGWLVCGIVRCKPGPRKEVLKWFYTEGPVL